MSVRRPALMSLFPPPSILLQVGRYAIHGFACRSTSAVLVKQWCCWWTCNM